MPWSAVTTDFTWIDLQFLLWIAEGNLRLGMLRRQKYMAWFKRQLTGNLCSCIPITWTYYPLLEQGKINMRNQQQTHTTGKSWSDQLMETIKTCEIIWALKCNLVLSLPSTYFYILYNIIYTIRIFFKKGKTRNTRIPVGSTRFSIASGKVPLSVTWMPWKRWRFPKPWGLPQLIYGKSCAWMIW